MKRAALPSYFLLACGISWLAMWVAAGPGGFPMEPDQAVLLGMLALLGPSLAGLAMSAIGGKEGLRGLGRSLKRWRLAPRWYAFVLLVAPLTDLLVLGLLSLAAQGHSPAIATAAEPGALVGQGLVAGLVVAFFEELGWTGFAVRSLRGARSPLWVGVVVGLVWGLWHFPMFWQTESFSAALPFVLLMAKLFAWLPPFRVLMAWVYERTESAIACVLMHTSLVATLTTLEPRLEGTALLTYIGVRALLLWLIVLLVGAWRPHERRKSNSPAKSV